MRVWFPMGHTKGAAHEDTNDLIPRIYFSSVEQAHLEGTNIGSDQDDGHIGAETSLRFPRETGLR